MKYKLINKTTNEEHICSKVVIDGFDYYVSDELIIERFEGFVIDDEGFLRHGKSELNTLLSFNGKKVIATSNPNIDLPKVVDKVEELTPMEKMLEDEGYVPKGTFKFQETHPFSEEDIVEFNNWQKGLLESENLNWLVDKTDRELVQLWKEQRINTIYYGK